MITNSEYANYRRAITLKELHELQQLLEEARDNLEHLDLYTRGNPILDTIGCLTKAIQKIHFKIDDRRSKI